VSIVRPPCAESTPHDADAWHVLIWGLPLADDAFDLGESLKLRRLVNPLSVWDLAAAGSVGFREWAVLEPFANLATSEIISPVSAACVPGYDAANKCWLASSLFVIRGFSRHLCLASSSYSWNCIAGSQRLPPAMAGDQPADEEAKAVICEARASLPPFRGQLLDYHLRLFVPGECRSIPVNYQEAEWVAAHLARFNLLASKEERFRFALEAAVDWRYARDPRAAVARIWAGIESLLAINAELVYRVSLCAATVLAPRGPERIAAFWRVKALYGLRSKAVHGEPLSDERLFAGLHDSFDVLRALLLDVVHRGALRGEVDFCNDLLSE
jgi:hypothetical protein